VLFAVCPGGALAIKSNETYLNSAMHVPAGLYSLATVKLGEKWTSADHRVPPGPADILAEVRLISTRQRVERKRSELQRRIGEEKTNRLTPEKALAELEARRDTKLPVDPYECRVETRVRRGLARIAGIA
jgi:hypothetical protein